MRLKDKVSIITGASRGIGKAIALTFGSEGANVIVNFSKSQRMAEEVADEIRRRGGRATAIQADVSNREEVSNMVEMVVRETGRIDVLVNNAGIVWRSKSILDTSKEEWDAVLGVNFLGTCYCIQAVAPFMMKRRYGKIINISSVSGIGTFDGGHFSYAPSKAAVNALTKKLGYELGAYGINVNAIAPGLILTEGYGAGRSEEEVKKIVEEKIGQTALKRAGRPEDVANLALFLASNESNFITGQVIVTDGGRFDYLSHSL